MTSEAERIAKGLSEAQARAVQQFQSGNWYGTAEPSKEASYCKGKLCQSGLLEHDGDAPVSHYRLTALGLEVRQHLLNERSGS